MHQLEIVLCEANLNGWPYPKRFDALVRSGVAVYNVNFIGGFRSIYEGIFGIWHEPTPIDYISPELSDQFSQESIEVALINHRNGKTSYTEFLHEMAAAGVSHYTVDMDKRIVTYFGENENNFYEQAVPVWKE